MALAAVTEAVFGLAAEARTRAKGAIVLDRGRRTAAPSAMTLALTDEPAPAEAVLNDLLSRYPHDTRLNTAWKPAIRGAIALRQGDANLALQAAEPFPGADRIAWPHYVRGAAWLRLGRPSEAAEEFRKIIADRAGLFSAYEYGAAFAYPVAQLGLARALAMNRQVQASRQAYEQFLRGWSRADANIPILAQAKSELAALPNGR